MRSTRAGTVNWLVTAESTVDVEIRVIPDQVALAPGGTTALDISASTTGTTPQDTWLFATVVLTPDDPDIPVGRLPLAVRFQVHIFSDDFESGDLSEWVDP